MYQKDSDSHNTQHGGSDDDSESDLDEVRWSIWKKAWDHILSDGEDHLLLFGARIPNVTLSAFHPNPGQILKLWQIYLERVDPLLKVTHTPTLQPRIIDAAGNVANVSQGLEALIFSIYCVAVLSLEEEEATSFGLPKKDLLAHYQFGCQQALLNCGIPRTEDLECLTALYLYLVSSKTGACENSHLTSLGICSTEY